MELSTITRPRPVALAIPLADEVLNITYDANACTLERMGGRNIITIVSHTLLDWDLTSGGVKHLPDGFDPTATPEARAEKLRPLLLAMPVMVVSDVSSAIGDDFLELRRSRRS